MYIVDPKTEPLLKGGICRERSRAFGAAPFFPCGSRDPVRRIPRSMWTDTDLAHFVHTILDQNGINACTAGAACTALQIVRRAEGLSDVKLAMGPLYSQINGGQDQGAPINAALEALMNVGTLAASECDELEWRAAKLPANWRARARDFRILEAWDCADLDDGGSAMELGCPIVTGIDWGRGAHAICLAGKKHDGQAWLWHFVNDWGADWGEHGLGWLREADMTGTRRYGLWALRCATVASVDAPPPEPR